MTIHDYLISVIGDIESFIGKYLIDKGLNKYLITKRVILGKPNRTSILYGIILEFFEEMDEIGFRENDIRFYLTVDFPLSDKVLYSYSIARVYNEIQEAPLNIDLSSIKEKIGLQNLSQNILKIMDQFFQNAIDQNGNVDEIHLGLSEEDE